MVVSVLSFLHHATTLLFGVYVSAAFLGISMNRKNLWTLFGFSAAVGAVYLLSFLLFSTEGTEKLYPLIVHLPLILFLTWYSKQKAVLCTLAVLTAYLCCQVSKWIGLVAWNLTQTEWVYYGVRVVITAVVFAVLMKKVPDAAALLLQKPTGTLMILGLMPFVYYLFDYVTEVYTSLLYSGKEVVAEFLGFVLCMAYILFLFLYFRQYETERETRQLNQLMEMKRIQSEKEIEAIRRSEYEIALVRHDMRHFLTNISSMIENGESEKAQEYIREVVCKTDQTARKKYCANEIVNMILSAHEKEICRKKINFRYTVEIPSTLPFSDVDLTAILSNGLENAIHAVQSLPEEKRRILFEMRMNEGKLLISVKNTYAEKPRLENGLPQTTREGHGFGTRSIRYVAEKLKGNCRFFVTDEFFVLQAIL